MKKENIEELREKYPLVYPIKDLVIISKDHNVKDAFDKMDKKLFLNNNVKLYLEQAYVNAINRLLLEETPARIKYFMSESKVNILMSNACIGTIFFKPTTEHVSQTKVYKISMELKMNNTEYSMVGNFAHDVITDILDNVKSCLCESDEDYIKDAILDELISLAHGKSCLYKKDDSIFHQEGGYRAREVLKIQNVYKNGYITYRFNGSNYRAKASSNSKEAIIKCIHTTLLPILEQGIYYSKKFNQLYKLIDRLSIIDIRDCSSSEDGIIAKDMDTNEIVISFDNDEIFVFNSVFENEDDKIGLFLNALTKNL